MASASAFECPVCLAAYDFSQHMPLVLPTCGHTFCYTCVSQLPSPRHCPTDRRPFTAPLDQLPKNYALLAASSYAANLEALTYLQDLGKKAAALVHVSPDMLQFPPGPRPPAWGNHVVARFNGSEVVLVPLPSQGRSAITAAAGLVCSAKHFRHTTKLYGIAQLHDTFHLVHQLLRHPLAARLQLESGLSTEEKLEPALRVGIVAAKALVQLHAVGFTHGNISADSVALDEFEDPLLDLRCLAPDSIASYNPQAQQQVCGTPASKEDVRQVAALMLHMLTGVAPRGIATPPLPPGLPDTFGTLLQDCLYDPVTCPSAPLLLQGLQSVLHEVTGSGTPTARLNSVSSRTFATLLPQDSHPPRPLTPTSPHPPPRPFHHESPQGLVASADPLCLLTFLTSDHPPPTADLAAARLHTLLTAHPPTPALPTLLPPLTHLLGHRTNPAAVHAAASLLLATLSAHPTTAPPALINSGALPRLLSYLPRPPASPTPATPPAASILAHLASPPDPTTRLLLTSAGAAAHLRPLLDPTAHPPDTLACAAATLHHLSSLPEGRDAILATGCIPPLVHLLSTLAAPQSAGPPALATLDSLAQSDDAKLLMAECRPVPHLVPALHPSAAGSLLEPATQLVSQLAQMQCNRHGLLVSGLVALLQPLLLHANPVVSRNALTALEQLAADNPGAPAEITETGCLTPLVQLLRHPEAPTESLAPAVWATAHVACAYQRAAKCLSARTSPAAAAVVVLLGHRDAEVVKGALGVMRGMVWCKRGVAALRRARAEGALGVLLDARDEEVRRVAGELVTRLRRQGGCLRG